MTAPEDAGFSTERLERIRPVMQGYVDDGRVPGFLTVVARRGKIVHFETVGMRDIENKKPVEADTIYRIYSMSKPITSVAVMMLYEEGHFQLDTPVSDFIPEFKNIKVYNKDQTEVLDAEHAMTIKHLLTHTAGLTYGWGGEPIDKRYREANLFQPGTPLGDTIKRLSEIPLAHEPGEQWTYGVSTDVLGYLVERAAGMPFEEFLRTRLFEPLGMVDTAFSVPVEKLDRFAALYQRAEKKGAKPAKEKEKGSEGDKDTEDDDDDDDNDALTEGMKDEEMRLERVDKDPRLASGEIRFFPSGGGGLVSTAADYMRFSQMLLNGGELGGVRILDKETVELMRYPHHDGWFGLGFHVVNDKDAEDTDAEDAEDTDAEKELKDTPESVGTFSWGGAAGTLFWIDPEKELIGLLMTQIGDPASSHAQFKVLTYEALTE